MRSSYRDKVVQVQRPVHLEVGCGHDERMHQVRAVREPAERLQEPAGQGGVDASSVAGAAGDHNPGERGAPGRVADGRVQRGAGHVQVDDVQPVHQVREAEQRQEPSERHGRLQKAEPRVIRRAQLREIRDRDNIILGVLNVIVFSVI